MFRPSMQPALPMSTEPYAPAQNRLELDRKRTGFGRLVIISPMMTHNQPILHVKNLTCLSNMDLT